MKLFNMTEEFRKVKPFIFNQINYELIYKSMRRRGEKSIKHFYSNFLLFVLTPFVYCMAHLLYTNKSNSRILNQTKLKEINYNMPPNFSDEKECCSHSRKDLYSSHLNKELVYFSDRYFESRCFLEL